MLTWSEIRVMCPETQIDQIKYLLGSLVLIVVLTVALAAPVTVAVTDKSHADDALDFCWKFQQRNLDSEP